MIADIIDELTIRKSVIFIEDPCGNKFSISKVEDDLLVFNLKC